MKNLSIKEAFASAWKTFSNHMWVFIGSAALIGAVSYISGEMSDDNSPADFFIGFATAVLLWWLYIGFIRICMTAYAGGAVSFDMLFGEKGTTLVQYALAAILSGIITVIGFILLIVPGIMLQLGLMFVPFLILDKDMKSVAALKESWRITKGYKWNLFQFLLLIILINILGVIPFGVGLLVTAPISVLVITYLYREIEKGVQLAPVASAPVTPVQ